MMRYFVQPIVLFGFMFTGLVLLSGCSSFVGKEKSTSLWPWQKTEEKPQLPTRILTIWTDAVHHQAGEKAKRGFGGRVVFYATGEQPIQVDGTLTIYVFADEAGQESPSPERKYVFGAAELKQHYSKCSLGDSYSVWLPWDVVGGTSRQLTLIARFDSTDGGTVMSDPAKKMLPGLSKRPDAETGDATAAAEISNRTEDGASTQLRPLRQASKSIAKPVSASRSEGHGPAGTRRSAARSIAEVLQEQREVSSEVPSSTSTDAQDRDGLDSGVTQVGYEESESDSNITPRQKESSSSNSRVETIQLGRLRSSTASVVNVPQHWLHQSAADFQAETTDTYDVHDPERQAPRTNVSYGRPGESRLNSSSNAFTETETSESSGDPKEEPWPRRTRTMGSGRRSIAESRRDAMAERRPEKAQRP
ncbi:MAG: hypothetical protein Q8M16_17930 [Pirellulaceae bacterium]|nr:hypothetical protein [Pirellulaceae bacterium]